MQMQPVYEDLVVDMKAKWSQMKKPCRNNHKHRGQMCEMFSILKATSLYPLKKGGNR